VQLWDGIVTKQSRFYYFLTAVRLIPVSVFNFFQDDYLRVSDVFMVVFSDEHGQLPPRHHR
jgi:hypothetical protein